MFARACLLQQTLILSKAVSGSLLLDLSDLEELLIVKDSNILQFPIG